MKKSLLLLIAMVAISCNKDDSSTTDNTALTLVTGVTFRQSFDDAPYQLGNPNVLINDKFTAYPNPAGESIQIVSTETITDIWMVPATPQKIYQEVNFGSLLTNNLYAETMLSAHAASAYNGLSANNYNLNLGTLNPGYYRVFVKIGGAIYWDNLYHYDNQTNTENLITELTNYWN